MRMEEEVVLPAAKRLLTPEDWAVVDAAFAGNLDPFAGAGTTGLVADRLGRNAILIELNPEYAAMAHRRIVNDAPLFAEVAAL